MPNPIVLDEAPKLSEVKPLIESSFYRSYRAYLDAGIKEEDIPRKVDAPYKQETRFLSQVNLDKGPLVRKITKMIRRKEAGKEYLTFTENWTGYNWLGVPIENPMIDRMEGIAFLPRLIPVIDEKGQRIGKRPNGDITKYEIEFSKENVDKWIEQTGSNIEEMLFCVRTSNRRDEPKTYDQFVSTTWIQANDIMMQDGGFEMAYVESLRPDSNVATTRTKKA